MADPEEKASRFTRIPRAPRDASPAEHSRVKLTDSLDAITKLLCHAVEGGRDAFQRDSPAYACGSLAMIRIAALFETDEFHDFLGETPEPVRRAIVTIRNIASHSGYRSMNDDVFWSTLTDHLPAYLTMWRSAVPR